MNKGLDSFPARKAAFIEPMECLAVAKVPDGAAWLCEIKLDGYRAEVINSDGKLILLSRRRKSFNRQFPLVVEALADLPDDAVIDGEVVALDQTGRPDFNLLQTNLVYCQSSGETKCPKLQTRRTYGTGSQR